MARHNYLCIQRSQPSQRRKGEGPSPAQMEEMYAKFNAWKEKFQSNIVDMGGRLGGGKIVTLEGAVDGPFVEAKEVVGGFMIVSADNLDEAAAIARECPGVVSRGSSVEVREIIVP
ncbi:MAG: YciI family protein [Steroidobacter sp.]